VPQIARVLSIKSLPGKPGKKNYRSNWIILPRDANLFIWPKNSINLRFELSELHFWSLCVRVQLLKRTDRPKCLISEPVGFPTVTPTMLHRSAPVRVSFVKIIGLQRSRKLIRENHLEQKTENHLKAGSYNKKGDLALSQGNIRWELAWKVCRPCFGLRSLKSHRLGWLLWYRICRPGSGLCYL